MTIARALDRESHGRVACDRCALCLAISATPAVPEFGESSRAPPATRTSIRSDPRRADARVRRTRLVYDARYPRPPRRLPLFPSRRRRRRRGASRVALVLVPVFVFVDSRFFGDPAVNGDERAPVMLETTRPSTARPAPSSKTARAPRPAPPRASLPSAFLGSVVGGGSAAATIGADEFGQGLELGLVQVSLPRGVPRGHRRSVRARIARHDRLERACRSCLCRPPAPPPLLRRRPGRWRGARGARRTRRGAGSARSPRGSDRTPRHPRPARRSFHPSFRPSSPFRTGTSS